MALDSQSASQGLRCPKHSADGGASAKGLPDLVVCSMIWVGFRVDSAVDGQNLS